MWRSLSLSQDEEQVKIKMTVRRVQIEKNETTEREPNMPIKTHRG